MCIVARFLDRRPVAYDAAPRPRYPNGMILIDTSAWIEFLRDTACPICGEVDRLPVLHADMDFEVFARHTALEIHMPIV